MAPLSSVAVVNLLNSLFIFQQPLSRVAFQCPITGKHRLVTKKNYVS